MFNNYTESETYECCNVVQASSEGNGALLIGDFNSAIDPLIMKEFSIKTIITAALGMEHLQIPPQVEHITYPLLDAKSENISRFFDQSTTKIKSSLRNGGVLVHCAAGISRSATLVIAYIMKTRKISFKDAIAFVRISRNVRPNLGFERQLKQYQKQITSSQNEKKIVIRPNFMDKVPQQRKTSYNRSSHLGRMFNQYMKIPKVPNTADESTRKRTQFSKRGPFSHSQSRPRDREHRSFKIRAFGKEKEVFCVLGQSHGVKQNIPKFNISLSGQIKPPLIQNHHKNALNNCWVRLPLRKNY